MNGAGSSVLPQQKTCGVDEERAFKQSLKLLDSQTRRFILIKLHFFTSLFVVTGLLSCTAVAVWLISGSLFQLLPEEEATTSAMFECGHYNGSVSGVLHGKNISGPCQEDRRHEWCTYVWLRYSSKTWSMLSLWHSVQFVCFVLLLWIFADCKALLCRASTQCLKKAWTLTTYFFLWHFCLVPFCIPNHNLTIQLKKIYTTHLLQIEAATE